LFTENIAKFKIGSTYFIGKSFWDGLNIVPIILLAYLFNGIYLNFMAGIQIEKKTQYVPLVTGIGAFVSIVGNYLLIPIFGMVGSAYATLMSYVFMAVSLYYFSQKFYRIEYEWWKVIKIAVSVGISMSFYYLFNSLELLNELILKLISLFLFVMFLFVFKLIDKKNFKVLFFENSP
ncbi:MAG: polysaccharide biosynthesis C-terminal domain-containing protein, partial [Ignavibacteria bacterium]|nr:polysaccharide biosynthesis C-terminal domain-containing protein [Ignavibacteria bacterium]